MSRYWSEIRDEAYKKDPELKKEVQVIQMKMDLISALIEYRAANSLTQKDFAELIGAKQQAISRFEKGEIDPRLSFIRKVILEILGDRKIEFSKPNIPDVPMKRVTANGDRRLAAGASAGWSAGFLSVFQNLPKPQMRPLLSLRTYRLNMTPKELILNEVFYLKNPLFLAFSARENHVFEH
ncbi:MAG: helix-turn-helix domain-containing protein [Fusobacteriaceae bacterium]|jgi:DNA-binding XRE family transcriptional regulator|nr:helix-turn-helix domain-containing protein [Fusobacteriaceae bacterium]